MVGSEERVLSSARKLASRYHSAAKQDQSIHSVDELLAMAALREEEFHATMRDFVEGIGGLYDRGPLKQKARIKEKMYGEFNGCVTDVKRIHVQRISNGFSTGSLKRKKMVQTFTVDSRQWW